MRILSVRFRNLNSLSGEWHIDFSHSDYFSDGLFAISGPTGSGKTTILDAICLGLYGRTPRLDKVTKSSNEIMSRQAGECFSEVTFETQKGRFRCHWSQHRARRKPDGELQPARHEISDVDSGKVLESKMNSVGEFIEKATGMDYERFTRSMLLAQGGFAAFLQATPDKRAPILEQITGTGIYSRISEKVHERHSIERERLELLQAELKGIRVLSIEEEQNLQSTLQEKQDREKLLSEKANRMRKALQWLEGIRTVESELVELEKKRQKLEEHRAAFEPEARKLARARKALGLEGSYQGIVALRRQQETEIKALAGTSAILPEKDKARAKALKDSRTAEAGLKEAQTRQLMEGNVIKKVRELDTRLREQKRQFEEKDKALAGIGEQKKRFEIAIEAAERDLAGHQDALKYVNDYLEKSGADAALQSNLSAIARSVEALRDIESRHFLIKERIAAAADKKENIAAECGKLKDGYEILQMEYEKGRDGVNRLTEQISTVLEGREISQWRGESDFLKDRERLLIRADEMIERIEKTRSALTNLSAGLEASKAERVSLLQEVDFTVEKTRLLERDMENLQLQETLLTRIRDLEEDRKRLEDGKPCPLCGAIEHPYAQGNVPELNEVETSLKEKKTEFKEVSEKLRNLEVRRAGQEAEIQHSITEAAEKKALLESDEKQFTQILQTLGIEMIPGKRAAIVAGDIQSTRLKISATSRIVSIAEKQGKKENEARKTLEEKRLAFEKSQKALQDAVHRFETACFECERLFKDGAALAEEADMARAALLKDVEPFGIGQIPSADLDGILNSLKQRRDTWQARQEEKTVHEKKINDLLAGIDKNKALRDSLEKDLDARRNELNELNGEYKDLCIARRDLFGEQDPDQKEKSLATAVESSGRTLEQARDELGRIEKEISALQEKIIILTRSITFRKEELAGAERDLSERIKKAGFEDEVDFLASRLSEGERELLASKENSLIREETELEARRQDRMDTLAAEHEKRLTDQPMETLQEHFNACETERKEIGLEIGGILKTLGEDRMMKEKQQERLRNIEAQKRECTRWNDLHELIGSADGKKFRNFAQGLTFEMMTRHANRQLRKMTDRYLLIRDLSQPLELNVIDNYQAGEIRSTKNLSGGESFIVSLALALGLSQMASRNVRVDSLFLDEGFGTLDEDALETALETLAGLRQDGKLIGVISHVAALKERIGTRIQVTPETGGRSTLSGPGCRRL